MSDWLMRDGIKVVRTLALADVLVEDVYRSLRFFIYLYLYSILHVLGQHMQMFVLSRY